MEVQAAAPSVAAPPPAVPLPVAPQPSAPPPPAAAPNGGAERPPKAAPETVQSQAAPAVPPPPHNTPEAAQRPAPQPPVPSPAAPPAPQPAAPQPAALLAPRPAAQQPQPAIPQPPAPPPLAPPAATANPITVEAQAAPAAPAAPPAVSPAAVARSRPITMDPQAAPAGPVASREEIVAYTRLLETALCRRGVSHDDLMALREQVRRAHRRKQAAAAVAAAPHPSVAPAPAAAPPALALGPLALEPKRPVPAVSPDEPGAKRPRSPARPKPRLGVDQQALEGAYGADAQRAEKRRAIELHVRALEHAAACPGCERKACAKMAGYLRHAASCTQGAACLDCRRIDTLVQLHARRCTLDLCRVPGCVSLRERLRVESWKAALEG